MFQLTKTETDEWQRLRSQIVTLKKARGTYIQYQPHAFSEHGILMLSSKIQGCFSAIRQLMNPKVNRKADWIPPRASKL